MKKFTENPIKNIKTDGGMTAIFRTIGFIGDSLSSGEHEGTDENGNKTYHDYYEYSWGQFIARKCGLKGYNFSRGGLTAKTFNDYAGYNHVYTRENQCQAYTIALGVNDLNPANDKHYSLGFGSISDVDFDNPDNNKDSLVGWYVRIIQYIRRLQPKARIFVITPPTESPESADMKSRYDRLTDFLRTLPDYFEFLYVIDLRKYAPVYDEEFRNKYYLGGHLSAAGYKFTADMISTYIDAIIENNPEDFRQVAFIGKEFHNATAKW